MILAPLSTEGRFGHCGVSRGLGALPGAHCEAPEGAEGIPNLTVLPLTTTGAVSICVLQPTNVVRWQRWV